MYLLTQCDGRMENILFEVMAYGPSGYFVNRFEKNAGAGPYGSDDK